MLQAETTILKNKANGMDNSCGLRNRRVVYLFQISFCISCSSAAAKTETCMAHRAIAT